MIPKIGRGRRAYGLLRYLYGPGRREEHVDPHLVAAWDGAGPLSGLEPPIGADGKPDLRKLADLLEQPVRRGVNPPRQPVWHCSIRTHPEDRWLTDEQWARIGAEVMAKVGLAPHDDPRAVRWVAVRHAPDHIHIVATLVRQDRRTAWARNDRWLAQAACRDLEERCGLHRVGPTDRTAHTRPTTRELHKAARTGRRERPRDQLRRHVRHAAAVADSQDQFFALLRDGGLRVRTRTSTTNPGQVTGYAVALASHTTAAGEPVWYGGGRLAPDLTLPQLHGRWGQPAASVQPPPRLAQAELYDEAAGAVRAAAELIGQPGGDPAAASAAAYAAADTLTAAARLLEGDRRGPLHRAAEALDRATREPYRRPLPSTSRRGALRSMSRRIRLAGELSHGNAVSAMLRLIRNMSMLADSLAELRDVQRRLHQARAARTAARLLRSASTGNSMPGGRIPDVTAAPPSTRPSTMPPTRPNDARRQSGPGVGHGR
ncbi:relaxase [Dactylosporangium sp. NPDC051485]|uniref:relaxase/mobilization nuclease domain-containing protein n=1 Tax=Dactylosporangium sp. NPDC051485 TaxID=3154846 RepID=UPI003434E707